MSKCFSLLILVLAVLLCFVGCNQNDAIKTGVLELSMESDVGKGLQAVSMEVVSYNVVVKNSSDESVFESKASKESNYAISVPVGTYNVTVEGLNRDGDVVGTGSALCEVRANKINSFSITVTELQGNGWFSMSITANDGYALSYLIKDASGTIVKTGNLTYLDGKYTALVELANGFYSFCITRTDTSETIKLGSLRIIKDKTAVYDAAFQLVTDGSVSIVNEISQTPSITISLESKSVRCDGVLKASSVIAGISPKTAFWVIDETPLSEPKVYEDLEVSVETLCEGEHTLSLFVFDDKIVWSESVSFNITSNGRECMARTSSSSFSNGTDSVTVKGEVEFNLVNFVLLPDEFYVNCSDKNGHSVDIVPWSNKVVKYVDEDSVFTCLSITEGYTCSFFKDETLRDDRTVVFIIIDRDIEISSTLSINISHENFYSDTQTTAVYFKALNSKFGSQDGWFLHRGALALSNYIDYISVKVPSDTYSCTTSSSNWSDDDTSRQFWSVSNSSFTVSEGEEFEISLNMYTKPYSAYITVDLSEMIVNDEFSSLANRIDLYCGNSSIGGWTGPTYFNCWPSIYRKGLFEDGLGENLSVRAVIGLNEGVSEDDFPYRIVADVETLSIEKGNSYTIKFTVIEKE